MDPNIFVGRLITWNGIITEYGNIQHLAGENDVINLATKEETELYLKTNHS